MKSKTSFSLVVCLGLLASLLVGLAPAAASSAVKHTIETSVVGGGAVVLSPDKASYDYDDAVTISAEADPGWQFVEWQGNFDTPDKWWHNDWHYRLPIVVDAGDYARTDKPVEVGLNFTDIFSTLGVSGALAEESLRLVEVDSDGIQDDAVPFQFDPTGSFDPETKADGELTFLMTGTTPKNDTRTYHLYFDLDSNGPFTAATVPSYITLNESASDEGLGVYKIETSNAEYAYHRNGGGFSSLNDTDGNDWINWNATAGADGDFRGIPNLVHPSEGGYFHPGRTGLWSNVVINGPIKVSFVSSTPDGLWKVRWEIFPETARMTVEDADAKYWFLYEGTPGGSFDKNSDIVVRANGLQNTVGQDWANSLSDPQWVYVGDPSLGRSIFVAHNTGDGKIDSYADLEDKMTVLGIGRDGGLRYMESTPNVFTIGLIDTTTYNTAKDLIPALYEEVDATVGSAEALPAPTTSTDPTLNLTVTHNWELTAVFEEADYTLDLATSGNGSVTISPEKETYQYGDEVTLVAVPSSGWQFSHWTGDTNGSGSPKQLTIEDDTSVTAVFTEIVEPTATPPGTVAPPTATPPPTVTPDPTKTEVVFLPVAVHP